jgi:hypothetical protein
MPAHTNEQNLFTLLLGSTAFSTSPSDKASYLDIRTPTGNSGTVGITDGAGNIGLTAAANAVLMTRASGTQSIALRSIRLKGSAASQGIIVTIEP